jgi:hypothetical protein
MTVDVSASEGRPCSLKGTIVEATGKHQWIVKFDDGGHGEFKSKQLKDLSSERQVVVIVEGGATMSRRKKAPTTVVTTTNERMKAPNTAADARHDVRRRLRFQEMHVILVKVFVVV